MMAPLSDRWRWGINTGASLGHRRSGYLPARMALGTRWERVSSRCTGPARIMALAEGRPEDDKVVPIRR